MVSRLRILPRFSVAIALFPMLVRLVAFGTSATPVWFKEGVYVEYGFESSGIVFSNRTLLSFNAPTDVSYRWECVSLEREVAKLNIMIIFGKGSSSIRLSTQLFVNIDNREVRLSNETLVGKTRLWLPAVPRMNEDVILGFCPPDAVVGKVIDVTGGYMETPQGAQKVFSVSGKGLLWGRNVTVTGCYDLDTGVMIQASLESESTLISMGIWDPGLHGIVGLRATNIDLGPRELWPEILRFILCATPVGGFLLIFILVYRKRMKKRLVRTHQSESRSRVLSYRKEQQTGEPVSVLLGLRAH